MENQTFFYSNTHYSPTHYLHNNNLVSNSWGIGIAADRSSGFREYKPLGHTNYYGQTTLDMFNPGGRMNLPNNFIIR